jgi:hypothetical protein
MGREWDLRIPAYGSYLGSNRQIVDQCAQSRLAALAHPHRRRSNPHRARCTIASHFPRFRPLEGFVRRPPECLAPSVRGRHPKPFTQPDSCSAAKKTKLHQALVLRLAAIDGEQRRRPMSALLPVFRAQDLGFSARRLGKQSSQLLHVS